MLEKYGRKSPLTRFKVHTSIEVSPAIFWPDLPWVGMMPFIHSRDVSSRASDMQDTKRARGSGRILVCRYGATSV